MGVSPWQEGMQCMAQCNSGINSSSSSSKAPPDASVSPSPGASSADTTSSSPLTARQGWWGSVVWCEVVVGVKRWFGLRRKCIKAAVARPALPALLPVLPYPAAA
jgi:hypothetical protein